MFEREEHFVMPTKKEKPRNSLVTDFGVTIKESATIFHFCHYEGIQYIANTFIPVEKLL